jgi:RHS repeat-associated protein
LASPSRRRRSSSPCSAGGGETSRRTLARGTDIYYYLFDGLGFVVGLTDATGRLVNEYRYSPYGLTTVERETVDNPWRFTGQHRYDRTTGLYKIGHRYYDADVGRWTQRDPSNAEFNPYLYTAGNPINYTDPTGLHSLFDWVDVVRAMFALLGLSTFFAWATYTTCVVGTVVGCITALVVVMSASMASIWSVYLLARETVCHHE